MKSNALTLKEVDVIDLVGRAFPAMPLSAFVIDAHDSTGLTLRFILDDAFATDLPRERFFGTEDGIEDLAAEIEHNLKLHLGSVAGSVEPFTIRPMRQLFIL